MLDIRTIRERAPEVAANARNRNLTLDVDALLAADQLARDAKTQLDQVRQRRNEIGELMKGQMPPDQRQPLIAEGRGLKDKEGELEKAYEVADAKRKELLAQVPNFTHPDAPIGKEESDNKVISQHGTVPTFDFKPKDHVELMEGLDLVDFEGGAKVAGQKFYYLKNDAVMLELALVNWTMKLLRDEGFTPFITPDLARQEILFGTGFNPRGESTQIYNIENTDLSLVATAEITLGGLLSGDVIESEKLPLLYAGLSHCFRTEAGSAGRESRGLYRVHQFTKVEMFAFTLPEASDAMHQRILAIEERIFSELGIPYRVLDICTGDLGAPAYRKYDLEAWMPGRNQWGEVTSTSNCTDYQARRLDIRYRDKAKKGTHFVHMLNGTAISIARAILVLIELGQQKDGSIKLPACLGLADIKPR